jgi:hypothetical protein
MRFSGYEVEKKRLSHTAAMQKTNEIVGPKKITTHKSHWAWPAGYENEAPKVVLLSREA